MALTDKNIVITPNIGSATDDPKIVFTGATSSTGPFPISLRVYPTQSGTISLEGSAGQLFSIANTLSGSIFSVNDISGMPSIEVLDTGTIKLAQYGGNVGIGTASPVYKLDVSVPTAGPNVVAVRSIAGQSSYLSLAGNGSVPLSTSFDLIQDASYAYVWNRANTPLLFGVNNSEKFRISASGLTGTLPIGTSTSAPVNLVTAGNTGAWLGGFQDATSGWGLSNSVMALKSDNTTYSAIGMGVTNGLLYFARTNASGVGTLASWLTVASNMQTTFPYNINGVSMSLSANNASYITAIGTTNTAAGGGQFQVLNFAGTLANAVAGDTMIANNVGNLIISPNAAGKTIKLIPGAWSAAVAAEVTDTGLTVRGTQGLTINSGLNISWGGVYGVGIPTITNSGANTINVYASGSTDGITTSFSTSGVYTKATNNYGYGFWGTTPLNYGILMSTAADTTYGGRISGETTSDYNMYFTMTQGTNRGFVFRNAYATPLFSINGDSVRSNVNMTVAGTVTGSNLSGTNTGDNAANSNYASDYRAANFVAGTNYLAPSAVTNIGTTSIALNRASAAQALTGITSIDGSAWLQQTDATSRLAAVQSITTSGGRSVDLAPNTYNYGLFSEFKNASLYGTLGNYAGLITYANWNGTIASTGDPTYQLLFSPSAANATSNPSLKIRAGIDTTWGAWNTILHSGNWASFVSGGATLSDDNSTNRTQYIGMATATTGSWTTAYTASTKFTFNPSTGVVAATGFNSTSDARAKENIRPLGYNLDTVLKLTGKKFEMKDSGITAIGLIAQEVQHVVPEVVSTTDVETGMLGINYPALVSVLIEAMKDLKTELDETNRKLNEFIGK